MIPAIAVNLREVKPAANFGDLLPDPMEEIRAAMVAQYVQHAREDAMWWAGCIYGIIATLGLELIGGLAWAWWRGWL